MADKVSPQEQLICGVLAVQLGLTTPDKILELTSDWMSDPTVRLADRLLAERLIDAAQHQQLEAVLFASLQAHADDTGEVLETLGGEQASVPSFGAPSLGPQGPELLIQPQPGLELSAEDEEVILEENPKRYVVRREFGRGGQARVMLAFDRCTRREVAYKLLLTPSDRRREPTSDESTRQLSAASARFLREARVSSQLEHPNIIPIYELGKRADGALYYTMRLVRGEPLSAALGRATSPAERMKLLVHYVDVCNAVAYAHSRGIVHRDLKPANVMVGQFGETVLLDWGLAKLKGHEDLNAGKLKAELSSPSLGQADASMTLAGAALGTPAYMSPEQAEGNVEAIDERSDIWGLGAILYEILTGKPPFTGESAFQVMARVMRKDLTPVLELCPEAPSDLAAVAHKALRKPKEERYASAQALADEVSAWLTGKKVAAYDYSSWELVRRFAAKNKAAVAAAGAALAVILVALVAVSFSYRAESRARQSEAAAREREAQARQEEYLKGLAANFHLAEAYDEKADRLFEKRHLGTAEIFSAASLLHNPASPKGSVHDPGFVETTPLSLNLRAAAASRVYRARMRLLESLGARYRVEGTPTDIAFSADGSRVAVSTIEQKTVVFERSSGKRIELGGHGEQIWGVAFSSDSRHVATAGFDAKVIVWDAATGERLSTLEGAAKKLVRLRYSPDGTRIAAACVDGTVPVWDAADGKLLRIIKAHPSAVYGLEFSPDGGRLYTSGTDKTARAFDPRTGALLATMASHDDTVYSVAVSPDGGLLGAAVYDGTVAVWDTKTFQKIRTLSGHEGEVYGIVFSPGGLLATAGVDTLVRVWDPKAGTLLESLEGHTQMVIALAWSRDGATLASTGFDQLLTLWRMRKRAPLESMRGHETTITYLAWSPDGSTLASGSYDFGAIVWDLRTGAARFERKVHEDYVGVLGYSPDGKRLATPGKTSAFVWSVASGEKLGELKGHPSKVYASVFSPDGKLLATAGLDGTVRLWDSATFAEIARWDAHREGAVDVDFSPDG